MLIIPSLNHGNPTYCYWQQSVYRITCTYKHVQHCAVPTQDGKSSTLAKIAFCSSLAVSCRISICSFFRFPCRSFHTYSTSPTSNQLGLKLRYPDSQTPTATPASLKYLKTTFTSCASSIADFLWAFGGVSDILCGTVYFDLQIFHPLIIDIFFLQTAYLIWTSLFLITQGRLSKHRNENIRNGSNWE